MLKKLFSGYTKDRFTAPDKLPWYYTIIKWIKILEFPDGTQLHILPPGTNWRNGLVVRASEDNGYVGAVPKKIFYRIMKMSYMEYYKRYLKEQTEKANKNYNRYMEMERMSV